MIIVKPLINRQAKSFVIKKIISKGVEIDAKSYWGIMDEDEEREVG